MAYIQEVLVWSKPHEFSKDARELKSAHPHVSREHAQAMLIGEPCHQLLSRRLNPFRIRRELNVGKIPRGGLRWIQIRRDNQTTHSSVAKSRHCSGNRSNRQRRNLRSFRMPIHDCNSEKRTAGNSSRMHSKRLGLNRTERTMSGG